MSGIVRELQSLKLHGMAASYTELASQGLAGAQASEWRLKRLLEAERSDRHIRSIRHQIDAARFPMHVT